MRNVRKRLTYTNVVGTLALFISLSGVSYAAATLPKNSVGSAQLKKNAVTSKAIKDKSITGDDFKNSTITGTKIDSASIGTVAAAARAGTAASTGDQLAPVAKRVGPSANDPSSTTALHAATAVPLLKSGSVTVYGKCYLSGSSLYATLVGASSKDGTVTSYNTAPGFYGMPFLNPGKPEEQSYIYMTSAAANSATPLFGSAYQGTGTMVDVDGNGIQFQLGGWVKQGTLAAGDGAYGPGSACLFMASGSKLGPS